MAKLARRMTIITLMMTIFALGFGTMVAHPNHRTAALPAAALAG